MKRKSLQALNASKIASKLENIVEEHGPKRRINEFLAEASLVSDLSWRTGEVKVGLANRQRRNRSFVR